MRILLLGLAASIPRSGAPPGPPLAIADSAVHDRYDLIARCTHSNAHSAFVDGGVLGRFTGAVSCFLNAHMRLSVNYGTGTLDRGAVKGQAQFDIKFHLRCLNHA